jgi:hypothetical protein
MPCRQLDVDLVKQGISGTRGCAARLLGLDGRVTVSFWVVCPEETGPGVAAIAAGPCKPVLSPRTVTLGSVRWQLVGGYLKQNAEYGCWLIQHLELAAARISANLECQPA